MQIYSPKQELFLKTGDAVWLEPAGSNSGLHSYSRGHIPRLGEFIVWEQGRMQLVDKSWCPAETDFPGGFFLKFSALSDCRAGIKTDVRIRRQGYSLVWITLSDKGAAGERRDTSGPLIEDLVRESMPLSLARGFVLPDDSNSLKALLCHLCLFLEVDIVLTTGGTGVSARDISPQSTLALLEKRLPGMERIMSFSSWQKTPHGVISRAVAGTLKKSVIVNLPGSPAGVRENLQVLLPALPHAIDKLQGDTSDCGRP